MEKAILIINMPECCDKCFALNTSGDYPVCIITDEQRGYTFRTREQRMDKCPLRLIPEKYEIDKNKCSDPHYQFEFEYGYNQCIDNILQMEVKK